MTIAERFQEQLHMVGIKGSERMIVAVSGGIDSMTLLHLLLSLPVEHRPDLSVVHIQHLLRESDGEDALLVERFCKAHAIPFQLVPWKKDVQPQSNVEAQARAFRYHVLEEAMIEEQARFVATAHHADDQLETVLMRLVRGSTLQGMGGIQPIRPFGPGWLVRPLLSFEKEELRAYSRQNHVPYVEDETNSSQAFTRNRIRQQVIPLLKQEHANVAQHATEFREDLSDVLELAEQIVLEGMKRCLDEATEEIRVQAFQAEIPSVQRLLAQRFLESTSAAHSITYQRSHRDALLRLLLSEKPQASFDVSGGQFVRRYDRVFFQKRTITTQTTGNYSILIENEWFETENDGKIALFLSNSSKQLEGVMAERYRVDSKNLAFPLAVRTFLTGDRITVGGWKPFTKRLSRIFIDQKVPVELRKSTPVVVDAKDVVVWVVGYQTSIYLEKIEEQQDNHQNIQKCQYILGRKNK